VPAAPPASAADVTAVLPAQSGPESAHGRAGSRGTHGPRRTKRSAPQAEPQAETSRRSTAGRRHPAETAEQDGDRGSRARTLTVLALCLAALALLYGIALLAAGGVLSGTIPAGVSVDGVPLGGLSPAAARSALGTRLGPAAAKPIELQVGQTPVTLDPAKAGLSLDAAQTVAAAQGERTNPFTVIPALFGVGHQLDPVVSVDKAALTAALNGVAASYDSRLVEGRITFANGQPVVTAPREGRGFDVAAAANAVASGYLRVEGPIVLPVNTLSPLATPEALQNALEQIARPAVSAPITVVTGGIDTVLTPDQIGAALTIGPDQSGTMVPTLDGGLLRADLNPAALSTEQPGVDASYTVADGRPQLVPEKDGVGYSAQALAGAVAQALTRTGSGRTVTVARGPLPPAFSTADAQALGVQAVLGEATLAVPDAPDRVADIQHATSLVMGSVVQPGAVWSFDKTVGSPIAANGYAEPTDSGQSGADASGADDLLATAVFDAAFRAGMGDTVHHPNAVYASRYPVGLDAAVVYPDTDLQWTNSGEHPVYVYAAYANGTLTVDLLGRQSYDQVNVTVSDRQDVLAPTGSAVHGCPARPAASGFQVNVTRVLMRSGAQVGTEQFHVTYLPDAGTTCPSDGTQSPSADAGATGRPSSGSSTGSTPSHGSGGGSSGGGSPTPTSSSPAPAPTNTGVLGGLLH
jgi:vancomycin resistance protein YoaR